jgi:hypothetical protein
MAAPATSFRQWINQPAMPRSLQEGTSNFDLFRELSLREVERLLLLSASHYRRAHDLMNDVSVGWAFVTLYYGAFFAASALLGMCGAWKLATPGKVIEPTKTSPGQQKFEIVKLTSTYRGSHQQFWDFYYSNAVHLRPWIKAKHIFSILPISGDVVWPITNRNDLNYDSFAAVNLSRIVKGSFKSKTFPTCLPGVLTTQFRFLENILSLAGTYAQRIGIETDAVSSLSTNPTRVSRIRALVVDTPTPRLGNKIKRRIASTQG